MVYRLFIIPDLLCFLWFPSYPKQKAKLTSNIARTSIFANPAVSMFYLIRPFGILFLGTFHPSSLPCTLPMNPDLPDLKTGWCQGLQHESHGMVCGVFLKRVVDFNFTQDQLVLTYLCLVNTGVCFILSFIYSFTNFIFMK